MPDSKAGKQLPDESWQSDAGRERQARHRR